MDGISDTNTKRISLEELSKEELIIKCKSFLAIAQKAKQAKDIVVEENNKLKEQLSKQQTFSSEEIIEKLTQQKVNLLTALEELKSKKIHLDNKFAHCENQLHGAENKISELDTANQSYKRRVDRLTEENEQLITHLDELEKQIEELKTVGLQQQQQLLALEKNNILLSKTNDSITEKLQEKSQNENSSLVIELENKLSVSSEEIKYLKSENSQLNDHLKELEKLLKNNEENLCIKNNELSDKIKIIEDLRLSHSVLEKIENENEDQLNLDQVVLKLENELQHSQKEVDNLKEEILNKNKEIEKNINVVDDLKTELHKNKALVEKLQQDVVNMNNKLTSNQIMSSGVASDLQNANERLKEKLKLYHSKIVKFAGDIKCLKQTKIDLVSTFKLYTSQVSNWKEQLHLLLEKIEDQDRENKEITLQNKLYKEDIDKEVAENKKLLEKLRESENYKECFGENKELKDLNKSLKEDINSLQQKLSAIEVETSTSNDKYLNLVKEKESLEKIINELREEYNNLEKQDSKGQNDYISLKEELENSTCQFQEKIKEIQNQYETERIKFSEQNRECHENSQKLIEENNKLKMCVDTLNIKIKDYDILQKQFEETQMIIKSLKEEILKYTVTIENNKQEMANYNDNCTSVIEEKLNLETALKNLQDDYSNLEKSNLEILKEIKLREAQNDEEVRKTRQEYENMEKKFLLNFERISNENQEFQENIKKYQAENKEFILREENLKSKIDELTIQFNSLQKKYKENESILELLTNELQNSKQTIDNLEKSNKILLEDLNGAKGKSNAELLTQIKKNDALAKVITNLEEKLQKLANESTSTSEEVQTVDIAYNFEERISSFKRENTELLSEMNEMNQALKERGETISNQEAYCEEILKKLQNCELQLNCQREELITKDESIRKLKEEITSLRTTNSSLNIENLDNTNRRADETNQLKLEIQELKDKLLSVSQGDIQSDMYPDSESMSTSTISKTEELSRMKDLDSSWEERYGKLRNLALKLKGKIRDLTSELQKEQLEKTELHQKHVKTIQSFQQQIDKLQDSLEASKNDAKQYLKRLDSVALDVSRDKKQLAENEGTISQLKSEIDGLNKEKMNTENWKKQVSSKIQALKKEQEANNLLKKEFENKINKLNAELESKDKALKQEIERHNQTKSVLQESNNECKKQSVLNLEMQDYERSVKELSQKIDKKQELVNKLKLQLEAQKTSLGTLKDQNQDLEHNIKSLEDKYDKINSENEFNKKKIAEFENIISEKDNNLQDLTYTIENIRSDNEDLSTQLSKAIAEHQKLNDNLKEQCDNLKSRNMGLEQSLREVQDILKLKEQEFLEMQKEYQGYKVRAQSVLRQNQSRDVGAEEKLFEEAATLRAQVDILGTEVKELRSSLDMTMSHNNLLQAGSGELIEKIKNLEAAVENHRMNYEDLFAKHQRIIAEHTETVRGLKIHSDTLAQCYRQQLSEQETRHNREIIELQSKMDRGNTPPDNSLVIPSMPREEGEGSESVDSVTNNGIHPIPLEKLLSNESEHEVINIKRQLSENESKVVHLTALLADTEQDLAKYVQLNKVLKEEIRRQQRSAEREEHAENLEYLKNVVFKFITLGSGDERGRLVPVLNTILKLSPEETQKLNNVARGEKGWSNYLPISWGSPNKPQ